MTIRLLAPLHRLRRRVALLLTGRPTGRLPSRMRLADDRGDVPGWVLVAVMTAGLVTTLWLLADEQLTAVLGRAIGSVTQP